MSKAQISNVDFRMTDMSRIERLVKRTVPLLGVMLLAGCATSPENRMQPTAPIAGYEAEPGRDAATIANLRAAPAPDEPVVEVGRNRTGDRKLQAAKGYVVIGIGHIPATAVDTRASAIELGRGVGADRILLYKPSADAAGAEWTVVCYVRFQLPFGATFRDLRMSERKRLDVSSGVVIGSVVGGTPASRANLISGDVVVRIDGKPIAGRGAFQSLLRGRAGHPVTLTILRHGDSLQRVVRLNPIVSAG